MQTSKLLPWVSFCSGTRACRWPLTHIYGKLQEESGIWGLGKVGGVMGKSAYGDWACTKQRLWRVFQVCGASKWYSMFLCPGQKGPYAYVSFASIIPAKGRARAWKDLCSKKCDPQETWRGMCVRMRHQGQICEY